MLDLSDVIVRFRFFVVAFWIVVAAFALPRAARVNDVLQTQGGSFRSTESQETKDVILENFRYPTHAVMAVAVEGPVPIDSTPYRVLIEVLSEAAESQPYIDRVVSYFTTADDNLVSSDRLTTFFLATVSREFSDDPGLLTPRFREVIHGTAAIIPNSGGYDVYVTGRPALDYDGRAVSTEDVKRAERRSLLPMAAVLVLAFGALLAAVLPIIIGVFAISCALAAVHIASAFHPMSVFVLTIVTMVGLAVGVDYSLLVVTRFREEMNRGHPSRDAAHRTLLTAGRAVITSGLTVAVGFSALLFTPIVETRSVGIGGVLVVTIAVLLSITLLPATLAIFGRWIDWPYWLARRLTWYHRPTAWEHWARWLAHHPGRALTIGLVIAAGITWPLTQIKIGLPARGWFPTGTESSLGAEVIERVGSRSALLPINITLQAPDGLRIVSSRYVSGLIRLRDSLVADPRIESVRGPVSLRAGMSRLSYTGLYGNLERARERYPEFFDSYVSVDGNTTLMDATINDSTALSSTMDVVRRIRQIAAGGVPGLDSVSIKVGGFAASNLDLQDDLLDGFPLIVGLIMTITGIMLLIAFRSVLVPVKAVVMNSLSVVGAFGLIVLVFQEGVGASLFGLDGAIEAVYVIIPVLVFAVVFGLSMDYEVFLLSRIKEAFDRTQKNDYATMEGLSVTASVITSAAAIMIIVFGSFAFSRVLAAKMLGFGLAVAVLLDATLIRMVLVPAFMHIAGRWNWWPGVRVLEKPEEPSQT